MHTVDIRPPAERRSQWLLVGALTLVVAAVQASAVTATGALVGDESGVTPKLYHVLLLAAGAILVLRGRIVRPRVELVAYVAIAFLCSLIAYLASEPRVTAVKLLVAFGIAVIAAGLGRLAGPRPVLRALRAGSLVFLLAVVAKNALHVPAFVQFIANPAGHPDVPSLAGGGLNLEATWLVLGAVFFIGTMVFVPYLLVAMATSGLYASRTGLVLGGLVVAAAAVRWRMARRHPMHAACLIEPVTASSRRARRWRRLCVALLAAVAALGAGWAAFRDDAGVVAFVGERFATIGDEPGSLGRLALWTGGLRVYAESPLGVGAGNAIPVLRRTLGVDVPEDNLHNIYLQQLVETGVPGLLALLVLATLVWWRARASQWQDRLLWYLALFLVAGLVQFTGVDAMLWLVYGLETGSATRPAQAPGV